MAVGKRHRDGMTGVLVDALTYWRDINGTTYLDKDDISNEEEAT